MLRLGQRVARAIAAAKMVLRAASCRTERVTLWYPPEPWYQVNAPAMLRILDSTAARLEHALGLRLPPGATCHVTLPDVAEAIQGISAAAYRDIIIVGVRERHPSEFGCPAAHELAHLASRSLRSYPVPLLAEGFACWAAALIEADRRPVGLPVHYHPAWMLSRGLRPSLPDLWNRRDYSPELYDLGWSLASFLAERFGREAYYRFYASHVSDPRQRAAETLDLPLPRLEREWHDYARSQVTAAPAEISRMHRYDGVMCSRVAWLKRQG